MPTLNRIDDRAFPFAPTSSPPGLAPEQAGELARGGYFVAPLLDAADVHTLLALHQRETPTVTADYYVSAFSEDVAGKRRIDAGIRGLVTGKLDGLVPGYRIVMASFVTKKAQSRGGRLGLHQDYSLVDHARHLGLNVWIPLADVDARNGCMRMVHGSQEFEHISATPPNPGPQRELVSLLETDYLTSLPMPAGSAVVFDTRVLHATEENVTTSDRVAVILNLVPEDVAPRLYLWDEASPDELDVLEVTSEYLLQLRPNRALGPQERHGAVRLGTIPYAPRAWSVRELEASTIEASPHNPAGLERNLAPAIADAVAFLARQQHPDGEFETEYCRRTSGEDGALVETWAFDSSPFVTALVVEALAFVEGHNELRDTMIEGALGFLRREMEPGGLWRYWARRHAMHDVIPPDLDDTACISRLLRSHGVPVPANAWLFRDSRSTDGRFYTWLYRADSLRKWLLAATTRGRAFRSKPAIWQWTDPHDICAVVNANVVYALGANRHTAPAIAWLLGMLRAGDEAKHCVFYADTISLWYMVSRASRGGAVELASSAAWIVPRLLVRQAPDGSFGDELATAIAIATLLNFPLADRYAEPISRAVGSLLRTQQNDGAWPRVPMYGGPPVPDTFGSRELTTAFALEALARWRTGFPAAGDGAA